MKIFFSLISPSMPAHDSASGVCPIVLKIRSSRLIWPCVSRRCRVNTLRMSRSELSPAICSSAATSEGSAEYMSLSSCSKSSSIVSMPMGPSPVSECNERCGPLWPCTGCAHDHCARPRERDAAIVDSNRGRIVRDVGVLCRQHRPAAGVHGDRARTRKLCDDERGWKMERHRMFGGGRHVEHSGGETTRGELFAQGQ